MLKHVIAFVLAVAIGAIGYAFWMKKDADESPILVMVTQMRTRADSSFTEMSTTAPRGENFDALDSRLASTCSNRFESTATFTDGIGRCRCSCTSQLAA